MGANAQKGIVYCRVSSQEQVSGTSLDTQQRACADYAERNRIQVLRTFIEKGESATAADRTEFLKALDYCRAHKIQAFIVWKIDRFARNTTDHFAVSAKLKNYGVSLHSVTEPISADPQGKLMETLLAGFAEFENGIRIQRCTSGMQAKLREGIWCWQPPIGYVRAAKGADRRKNQPDEPDPERFPLIQRALRTYATGKYSITQLTQLMNDWGLVTRTGKPMRVQLVETILKDKFYAGIIVDPWSAEEYAGRHKAMLTVEEYRQIQRVKAGFSNHADRPHALLHPDFPLRRFVSCACGDKLTAGWCKGRLKKYAYYFCKRPGCSHYGQTIARATLHIGFTRFLRTVIPEETFLQLFEASFLEVWKSRRVYALKEKERIGRESKKLELRKRHLVEMRMNNEISKDEFLQLRNTLDYRIAALQPGGGQIEFDESNPAPTIAKAIEVIHNLVGMWERTNSAGQNRLQKLVLPDGIVYDRTLKTFRTANLSPIFKLKDDFTGEKSELVAEVGKNLNRIWEHIKALAEFWRDTHDSPQLDGLDQAA
jgi:DNA invertase Pin-like site-specific DNA recombinase